MDYSEQTFEEASLPFETLEEDHIDGEQIYEALTSTKVQKELPNYTILSANGGNEYEVKMINESLFKPSEHINFEGRKDTEYSHLRIELTTKGGDMDALYSGLEDLENGLYDYITQEIQEETERVYAD